MTIDEAASVLGVTAAALQKRVTRASKKDKGFVIIADLGHGVVGRKYQFSKSWDVEVPRKLRKRKRP